MKHANKLCTIAFTPDKLAIGLLILSFYVAYTFVAYNSMTTHCIEGKLMTAFIEFLYTLTCARAIIKVPGHQYQWLAGGYDLEIRYF